MIDPAEGRTAVIFPGALGDFVCLLPAIHALARRASVEVFTKTEFSAVVPRHVRVSSLERFEINRLFVRGAALEPTVRNFFARYQSIYSWMGSSQPVFSAELHMAAPGRARLFPFRASDPAMHQTDYYLSCLDLSEKTLPAPNVPLDPAALAWRREFFHRYHLEQKARLVMAPGSGAREKNWPPEYFAILGRWWRERTGGEAIVLLGPVEAERNGFDALSNDFIIQRNLNLAHVAALLFAGHLYVGNDSGVTHLAAAAGVPVAAIFGPSDPRQWAPRGAKVSLLSLALECSPCGTDGMKACPHHRCLTGFSPAKIIEQLRKINEVATLTRGGSRITVQAL